MLVNPNARRTVAVLAACCAVGFSTALAVGVRTATAADHVEAPGTAADNAADIADVYAWHSGDKLVAVVTVAGRAAASATGPVYDEDVLYTVHIDRDGDNDSDIDVHTRFGRNGAGAWGVKVENLPGAKNPVIGPVDSEIDATAPSGQALKVFAGWREDPFFFDLDGFVQTKTTGTLSFSNTRDFFAGLNVTALVLEMDLSDALGGGSELQLWATTGRKP